MAWRPSTWDSEAILHRAIGQAIGSGRFGYTGLIEAGADAMLQALQKTGRVVDSDTLYVLTNDEDQPICVVIIPSGGQVG